MKSLLVGVFALTTCGCGGGGSSTPASPTPVSPAPAPVVAVAPLTAAAIAPSLGLEVNTNLIAALNAQGFPSSAPRRVPASVTSWLEVFLPVRLYAQTRSAVCRSGGTVEVENFAYNYTRVRFDLTNSRVRFSACGYPHPTRIVNYSGTLIANGSWAASAPSNAVTLQGSLDVNEIGLVQVTCASLSTAAGCNGAVGGITVGAPDTPPPPNPPPAVPPPAVINLVGRWTSDGANVMALTQDVDVLSGTLLLAEVLDGQTVVTNRLNGKIIGKAVTLTGVFVGTRVSAGATLTTTFDSSYILEIIDSATMSGTVTTVVTQACAGSASCPPNGVISSGTVRTGILKKQ